MNTESKQSRGQYPSVYDRMKTMSTVVGEAENKIRQAMEGSLASYITRWSKLNDAIDSIQEGEVIVVGGRPGSIGPNKKEFLLQIV